MPPVTNLLKLMQAVSVNVTKLCAPVGCTQTQGYWKTHVNYAPKAQFAKKRDSAWNLIDGAGTANVFFLSGKSYIAVMWTPPKGNPYYTSRSSTSPRS